jgi:hypothetical protein
MLKRILPIEARRRAYNNVTARWRLLNKSCKVNSFSIEVRERFEEDVNQSFNGKLLELEDEVWWPTEFIVWILHGMPCTDKNFKFIKISHGREPEVLTAKNLLGSVRKKHEEECEDRQYEGRRMKRLKLKQDAELNELGKPDSNESNTTYNHIIHKEITVGKLRSEYCFITQELIVESTFNIFSCRFNPFTPICIISRTNEILWSIAELLSIVIIK